MTIIYDVPLLSFDLISTEVDRRHFRKLECVYLALTQLLHIWHLKWFATIMILML